jgi:RHS repeat-associated protein
MQRQIGLTRSVVTVTPGADWEHNWETTEVYDYLPFGERIYSGDGLTHQRFTGKEHDENDLDYFGARYYDGSPYDPYRQEYRWISPDALTARIYDPQSLNKYTYVRNNPVNLVDHDGRDITCTPDQLNCTVIVTEPPELVTYDVATTAQIISMGIGADGSINRLSWDPFRVAAEQAYIQTLVESFTNTSISAPPRHTTISAIKNGAQGETRFKLTLPGANYCGLGGNGSPTNRVDAACAQHDWCYASAGGAWWKNILGIVGIGGSDMHAAMSVCDEELCRNLKNIKSDFSAGSHDLQEINQLIIVATAFGCYP